MLRSMTAFARVTATARQGGWAVELRSLNHRYFEFSLKAPAFLYPLEDRIRELIQTKIKRGKITMVIAQGGEGAVSQKIQLDEDMVRMYLAVSEKLRRRFHLKGELTVQDIIHLPQIFSAGKMKDNDPEKSWPSLERVLQKLLRLTLVAKEAEGRALMKDIEKRLKVIAARVVTIEGHAARFSERYFQKLSEKVARLTANKESDPDRFYREVAILVERSDIAEEIVRIKSHLDLFKKKMREYGPVGRELDFLCQEINREANTMASKAQEFEVSQEIITIKSELEKIREQVQNIE